MMADIRDIDQTYEAMFYRLYPMKRILSPGELSDEVIKAELFERADPEEAELRNGDYVVNAPLLVLDDQSFLSYAHEAGIEDSLDGIIVVDIIRDAGEQNFRQRSYLRYINEDTGSRTIRLSTGPSADENADISFDLLGYAYKLPEIKIDFWSDDYFELVHVVPSSLWEKALASEGLSEALGANEAVTTLNYISSYKELRDDDVSDRDKLACIRQIEMQIRDILSGCGYDFEMENRVQDRISSDAALDILRGVASVFCILLALIGLANVCKLTLSYTYKRRNICARLMAIGMTPAELHRSFYKEALSIIGPPVLLTILIVPALTFMMMKASYMDTGYGLSVIPVLPLLVFAAVIVTVVLISYRSSIKNILAGDLSEELKML